MRLWLLDEVKEVEAGLRGLVGVIVERADKEVDVLMPGYTHLQVSVHVQDSHSSPLLPFCFDLGLGINWLIIRLYSAANPSDGPISSSPMPFPSKTTSNVSSN